jgi:glycosyltransferase involved in cell wall biosynthesis
VRWIAYSSSNQSKANHELEGEKFFGMRVLFVISGLGLGGAEKQLIMLSNELVHRGHSVCIFALTQFVPRAADLATSSVELMVEPKGARLDLRVIQRLRRHIREWRPDIVHGFLYDGNIYARLAAFGLGVPVLDSERNDNYALSALRSIGYYLTSGMSRGVVANSYSGADFAARKYLKAGKGCHVLWNGIDLAEVDLRVTAATARGTTLFPELGRKRVVVVGNYKPQKDLLLALRVARSLIKIDGRWKMIIVGGELPGQTTEYGRELVRTRDEWGLQDYVDFVGSRRDVLEIISSSDAVLVTSHHEGFPNVVLEAMACRSPVISTEYSDVRRILPMDWQVVSSRNENDLAQALLRCDRERDIVVAAQRRWVETHATPSICAERLLSIYASYTAFANNLSQQVG